MKNISDVLKQKEAELERIQREIEVLRAAQRLLSDEADGDAVRATATANTAANTKTGTLRQFP